MVLPGFSDSRWLREAFPDCVAYGFFPQRAMDLFEAAPLIHGADERVPDRGPRAGGALLRSSWWRRRCDERVRTSSASAAWRCATGCSCTARRTGRRRCATGDGEIEVASGRKPYLGGRATERVPGVRGVAKLAEAMAVIPLVKRALPGGAAADAGRAHARRDGGRGARSARRSVRRGARTVARETAVGAGRAWRRRCSRCAAATSPPTTASSTSRSPPTSRTARPPTPTRSTIAAARNLVAPMLGAAAVGNVAARRAGLRGPAAEAVVGARQRRGGGGGVRLVRAPRGHRACRARCGGPGFEIQRMVGTREPTAEQLEVGRAALDEILRVEGAAA